MVKNNWLIATKILIWIMFALGFLGMAFLSIKARTFSMFFTLGTLILIALFVLSLFLHFRPKKVLLSITLGFILADLFLRFISLFSSYFFLSQRGVSPVYLTPLALWIIYEFFLFWTAYKAYKTFPA